MVIFLIPLLCCFSFQIYTQSEEYKTIFSAFLYGVSEEENDRDCYVSWNHVYVT